MTEAQLGSQTYGQTVMSRLSVCNQNHKLNEFSFNKCLHMKAWSLVLVSNLQSFCRWFFQRFESVKSVIIVEIQVILNMTNNSTSK